MHSVNGTHTCERARRGFRQRFKRDNGFVLFSGNPASYTHTRTRAHVSEGAMNSSKRYGLMMGECVCECECVRVCEWCAPRSCVLITSATAGLHAERHRSHARSAHVCDLNWESSLAAALVVLSTPFLQCAHLVEWLNLHACVADAAAAPLRCWWHIAEAIGANAHTHGTRSGWSVCSLIDQQHILNISFKSYGNSFPTRRGVYRFSCLYTNYYISNLIVQGSNLCYDWTSIDDPLGPRLEHLTWLLQELVAICFLISKWIFMLKASIVNSTQNSGTVKSGDLAGHSDEIYAAIT